MGRDQYDATPKQHSVVDFDAFQALVLGLPRPKEKYQTYICAAVGNDTTGKYAGKPHRLAVNAQPRAYLPLDLDGFEAADDWYVMRNELSPYLGFAYTTASSTPESPRARIILALSRAVDRDESKRLGLAFEATLTAVMRERAKFDRSVYLSEQQCYTPTKNAEVWSFNGIPLDVDELLRRVPAAKPHREATINKVAPDDAKVVARLKRALAKLDCKNRDIWLTVTCGAGRSTGQAEGPIWDLVRDWSEPYGKDWEKATTYNYFTASANPHSNPATLESIWRLAEGEVEWPRPIDLFKVRIAPPLTANDVPPVLGDYAIAFAQAAGFDPTATLSAAVATCAAAIDDGFRLRVAEASDFYVSARLWTSALGPPGCGKTPAQRQMLSPLINAHVELARKRANDPTIDPKEPHIAYFTSDATIDALSEVLRANPRGIIAVLEEMESWIGSLDAFRSGTSGSRDKPAWMSLYDGGASQIHRIQRGNVFVPNWGASLLTATTPTALEKLSPKLPDDGLLQRVMLFNVTATTKRNPKVDFIEAETAYTTRIRDLLRLQASQDNRAANVVKLSPEASAALEEYEDKINYRQIIASNISGRFGTHVSKHVGMMLRVALTFHAATVKLDQLTAMPVSEATMRMAMRYMGKVFLHAMVIYDSLLSHGEAIELPRKMASSILADRMEDFTRTTMSTHCRAFRVDRRRQDRALDLLADYSWIVGGGHYGEPWLVNPQVHELFVEQAEAHRAWREEVRKAVTGDG